MGFSRNGARTFLDVIAKACRLSRLPGFQGGLVRILGTTAYEELIAVWEPFCTVVDALIAVDNWYNKKDAAAEDDAGGDEDGTAG
jgi:hypothetical protein